MTGGSPHHEARVQTGAYVHPVTGERFDAVTSVIKATSSSEGLVKWAGRRVAEAAVDGLPTIASTVETFGRDAAVELLAKAPDRQRDGKGGIGKAVHAVAEALVLDEQASRDGRPSRLPLPEYDAEAEPYVEAFLDFYTRTGARFLAAEATVACREHLVAGTGDAWLELMTLGRRLLVDYKSTNNLYPAELALQLSPYYFADELWLPHGVLDTPPEVDGAAVLHLRPNGTYKLQEVTVERADFEAFLASLTRYRWERDRGKRALGAILRAPGEPVPLRELPSLGRCCGKLEAAGLQHLADLAEWTDRDLLALDGIGPKAVAAIRAALAAHGLTAGAAA